MTGWLRTWPMPGWPPYEAGASNGLEIAPGACRGHAHRNECGRFAEHIASTGKWERNKVRVRGEVNEIPQHPQVPLSPPWRRMSVERTHVTALFN